jgi:hypothetical protein
MADQVRDVEVQFDDSEIVPAKLLIWEESPENPELVKLCLEFRGKQISSNADDFFEAMCAIRKVLENEGALLRCYGASKNVYPSGMSRSMGTGEKAYKMTMGSPARLADLVSIFDTGPDVAPATLAEQEAFREAWSESLG